MPSFPLVIIGVDGREHFPFFKYFSLAEQDRIGFCAQELRVWIMLT